MADWETLDVEDLLRRREAGLSEVAGATTSGNAGAYQVPLGGGVLRRKFPLGAQDDYQENTPDEYAARYYDIYGSPLSPR